MILMYYSVGVLILILGLVQGTPRPRPHSLSKIARTGLFWISLAGLLGVATAVIAIIGIAAVFDERTDSVNGFDHLLALSQFIVITATALAAVGHVIVFGGAKRKPNENAEQRN